MLAKCKSWPTERITYLTRLGERVVDIEEDHSVLDWALVKRWVYRYCGGHGEEWVVL